MKKQFIFWAKEVVSIAATIVVISCSSDDEPFDCSNANLQVSVSNILDASCGLENGGFQITVSGGTAPFVLTIPGLGSQTLPSAISIIESIPGGNHNIILTDINNCDFSTNITINNLNNVTMEAEMEVSGCQTSIGTITVTATGGEEPYMYSLDGGAMQANNIFTGLAFGDYTALVTDDEGCQTSLTVSVLSGVSYNNTILPIIENDCAISGCHDGSNSDVPDWTDLATVQDNAANIKTRTLDGSMPPAGRPELQSDEIEAISCWVDDGALDN